MSASASSAEPDSTDSSRRTFWKDFTLLPEHAFDANVKWYHLHKDSLFYEKFNIEMEYGLEFSLLAWRDRIHFFIGFESRLGLGNRHQALLLDPRDIDLNFIPRIEWRPGIRLGDFMLFQLGLDHQCFHEIDRKETPAAYWNKFFLAARSRNWRPDLYWRMLRMKQRWIPADRFAWNLKLGCFPDELFGIVNPSKLSGNHPFKWQIQAKGRGALYGVDHWVLGLSGNANILSTYDNDWYWAQQIGIESVWGRSRGSAALFLTYDFDVPRQVPVFSRDRLLALGFRLVI